MSLIWGQMIYYIFHNLTISCWWKLLEFMYMFMCMWVSTCNCHWWYEILPENWNRWEQKPSRSPGRNIRRWSCRSRKEASWFGRFSWCSKWSVFFLSSTQIAKYNNVLRFFFFFFHKSWLVKTSQFRLLSILRV